MSIYSIVIGCFADTRIRPCL